MTELQTPQQDVELPTPNLPLLRKVLDHIDAHPEDWRQGLLAVRGPSCGTAYCIAGHVAAMAGEIRWLPNSAGRIQIAVEVELPDGLVRPIAEVAADHLGITDNEAWGYYDPSLDDVVHGLFSADNSREDVQRIAETIAARAGEVL